MKIPYTHEALAEAIMEVIRSNEFSSCYIRPVCFYGSDSLGVHPRECPVQVAILTWPWAPYLGAEGLQTGVRLTVSPWRKFHSRMMPTTAKACGQYLNSLLAIRDAMARGYDEALLLDVDDYLAEGSGENIFLVRQGQIITNNEDNSILLGITRDAVISIAGDLGYQVFCRPLTLDDLLTADEAFLTGTAAEVVPIREVDGALIANGKCGPTTMEIQRVFFDATAGRAEHYSHWLTPVNQFAEVVA
jgi:branched-chain amino acid aminotransferase